MSVKRLKSISGTCPRLESIDMGDGKHFDITTCCIKCGNRPFEVPADPDPDLQSTKHRMGVQQLKDLASGALVHSGSPITTVWMPKSDTRIRVNDEWFEISLDEGVMKRHCTVCGYEWLEAPLDHE